MLRRDEYKLLNKMLDDAIGGDFVEDAFDESELSKTQSKLMRYLSSASMSERNLQEEKNKLNELITNISHQTKTPLTNIIMYSELLCENASDEKIRLYAGEIQEQSKKLDALIKALIKMSRLETGIFQLKLEERRLADIAGQAINCIKAKANDKDIEIVFSSVNDASAMLDSKWATEAVLNVLDNSIKYSPAGSTVYVSIIKYEMFSGIRIADQGIGIPEDETAKVFSRFYRGRSVRDKDGIGVGLFLSRQIIEDHGGYIRISSVEGEGSTFDICFPNMSEL